MPRPSGGKQTGQSGDDLVYRIAVIDIKPLATGKFHPAGIEAKQLEDGRVDIGDVVTVFDGMKADFIGRAVGERVQRIVQQPVPR